MTFFLYPRLHTRIKRIFFPMAIRLSARLADGLIAVSEQTRQDALRILHLPPERITTVAHGISPAFHPISDSIALEDIRRKYRLPKKFILFVGAVEPRKNLPLLLKAYRRLADRDIPEHLVIAGPLGWMYDDMLLMIKQLGIQDRVLFTGYVPAEDLPRVYNLARVFVYPSLYEGFGLPPLEAMACGVPVVTTGVSAMLETVGEAAVLVPPQDEQALVEALLSVLEDDSLRQNLALAGPIQAAKYSWKNSALATIEVYRRTLSLP
jgi:glycosyltransferase involved in cell wall biosynthesis